MFRVTAVAEQNTDATVFGRLNSFEQIISDFARVVGKTVDFGIDASEVDGTQRTLGKIVNIFRPGKGEHGGVIANAVVIARNDSYGNIRNRGEQVADLL